MPKKEYKELRKLNEDDKEKIISTTEDISSGLKFLDIRKTIDIIKTIPEICRLTYQSSVINKELKRNDAKNMHPVRPIRGEIYNILIGNVSVGSELYGNHLAVILQNKSGNLYSEKVNILPIEGDGNKINPNVHIKLENSDLVWGKLDKDPSRIIIADIMTVDKARLDIRVGKVKPEKLTEVEELLLRQLAIQPRIDKK